jgi:hypothetical protein
MQKMDDYRNGTMKDIRINQVREESERVSEQINNNNKTLNK